MLPKVREDQPIQPSETQTDSENPHFLLADNGEIIQNQK